MHDVSLKSHLDCWSLTNLLCPRNSDIHLKTCYVCHIFAYQTAHRNLEVLEQIKAWSSCSDSISQTTHVKWYHLYKYRLQIDKGSWKPNTGSLEHAAFIRAFHEIFGQTETKMAQFLNWATKNKVEFTKCPCLWVVMGWFQCQVQDGIFLHLHPFCFSSQKSLPLPGRVISTVSTGAWPGTLARAFSIILKIKDCMALAKSLVMQLSAVGWLAIV